MAGTAEAGVAGRVAPLSVRLPADPGELRGLMLARALVDHLEISTPGAGTTVHLTRRTTTP